jgi:ornithine cyclodeaminase/alanine dehydrogenase-like protein (mu-crystallin family)
VLILSAGDVRRALERPALVAAMEDGFRALSDGQVDAPPRTQVSTPQGVLLTMGAGMPGMLMAVKLVTVFHGNTARGLPSHHAVITLFDGGTGRPVAMLDAGHLTAMRTAAAAVVSIKHLARPERAVVSIVGGGAVGHALEAMLDTLPAIGRVGIAPRTSIRAHVAQADVVCLSTSSGEPVIESGWLKPGTHVVSVGWRPPGSELPPDLLRSARVFVESRVAFDPPPAGCAELQGLDPGRGTELGEVLLGRRPGRLRDDEITLYKSMGHAMEDLVAANLVYERAVALGLGTRTEG